MLKRKWWSRRSIFSLPLERNVCRRWPLKVFSLRRSEMFINPDVSRTHLMRRIKCVPLLRSGIKKILLATNMSLLTERILSTEPTAASPSSSDRLQLLHPRFMEIYFQLIKDAEGVRNACRELAGQPLLGFDTETTELDPYRGDLRLVQFNTGKETYVIDLNPFGSNGSLRTNPALDPLRDLFADSGKLKVAHNAKFDAKWVRHHLGAEINGIVDTLLASQLIAAGDSARRHSLADVAQFFTGTELDKSEQISDWSGELSQSQLEYAARDAAIMIPLWEQMVDRLKNDELKRAAQLEFECIMPIAEMELSGFYLDEVRWREQLDRVRVAQEKAADELQDMLSAGVAQATLFGRAEINLDSQQQVTDALLNLGVPVPDTTRAWQLQPLAEKYPVVAKLLEYRGVAKSLSSFGENILEFIEPKTGRIQADFPPIGAPT